MLMTFLTPFKGKQIIICMPRRYYGGHMPPPCSPEKRKGLAALELPDVTKN
jgi:hypothetical protein